jgi:ATP-dependent exoDNAse (exonuclease V) beta subunit
MTIHKAKGLEWDVVLVPGMEKKAPITRERLLNWSEIDSDDEAAAHVVLAPIAGRGEGSTELNAWLKEMAKAREAAERKRLLYVAFTRAREELHLFASPKMSAKGKISREHGSLLATAWPAAARHFETPTSNATKMFEISLASKSVSIEDDFIGNLAAGEAKEEEDSRPAVLQRLPLSFDPVGRFSMTQRLTYGEATIAPSHFDRPEGSFEARAFGNAVHAFAEMLTNRLADGMAPEVLLREIAGWTPRIAAALRGEGIAPKVVERLISRVKIALNNSLKDGAGLWVLAPHDGAVSEFSLTSWKERRSNVRLDRVFLAGARPMEEGEDYLWIVDYKTTAHGLKGIDEFLAEERLKYEAQMETYARMLRDRVAKGKLRVGLYYPMLPRLLWWEPDIED